MTIKDPKRSVVAGRGAQADAGKRTRVAESPDGEPFPSPQDAPPPGGEKAPLGVLIVEDETDIREMIAHMVKRMGHDVRTAATGREALRRLREQPPDIVLLDLMMPEMDGFEFCRIVQEDAALRDLHIIITSAKDALEDKVKGLELGAADYLTKPFGWPEFRARIKVAERIIRYQKELKDQQALLEQMAREDKLTGLYNRRHFEERAQEECLRASRYCHPLSLLLGDIDNFKDVNDRYGHPYGDTVLQQVAQALLHHCRSSDLTARYGGEEFAVLLPEAKPEEARRVAERLCSAVRDLTFAHPSGSFQVTLSLGVTSLTDGRPQSLAELIDEADKALYSAKHKGRNRVEQWPGDAPAAPAAGTGKA